MPTKANKVAARLPPEILDQIVLDVESPKYGDDRYITRAKQLHDEESQRRLAILRLVNKDFCHCASIRFFRSIRMTLSYRHTRFSDRCWSPKQLFDLSRSEWCLDVRELTIDLSKAAGHQDLDYWLDDMVAILLACLTNFRNLASIALFGPAVDKVGICESNRTAVRSLATDLLRYIPMLKLKELNLALPLTCDFAAIMRRAMTSDATSLRLPLDTAMANIKHLDLTIYDSTPGDIPGVIRPVVLPTRDHPPNHAYAAQFFRFVELPNELESLRISCSHVIDMDHFDGRNLSCLKVLDLRKIKISGTKLATIITSCSSALEGVIFESVELKSGTWQGVFDKLYMVDGLRVFHAMGGCTYASDGLSAKWAPRNQRRRNHKPLDTMVVNELLSEFWLDKPALGNLQRRVVANRLSMGLQPIGDAVYRYLAS